LGKIEKFLLKPVEVHVFLSTERHLQRAEINVQDKSFSAHSKEECDDMYVSIDRAIDKVGKALKRHKEKVKDNKPTGNSATEF
jgi:putative sigma-54 modulation protein